MAESSLLCPHCEKQVEIEVAAVTLSRACPACGEVLVLQVAGKSGPLKRKALLVAPTPPVDEAGKNGEPVKNAYEALPEDPFERMRLDPSLIAVRRQFFMGVAVVLGLIVVATAAHYWEGDAPEAKAAPKRATVAVEKPSPRAQTVFTTMTLEERMGKFRAQDELDEGQPSVKPEKLAPPVFEISTEEPAPGQVEEIAPRVFEVSDLPAIAAPRP